MERENNSRPFDTDPDTDRSFLSNFITSQRRNCVTPARLINALRRNVSQQLTTGPGPLFQHVERSRLLKLDFANVPIRGL